MTFTITTTISNEFHEQAKSFNLSWAAALRVGLAILLLERGEFNFKNPLNKSRIKSLAQKLGLVLI